MLWHDHISHYSEYALALMRSSKDFFSHTFLYPNQVFIPESNISRIKWLRLTLITMQTWLSRFKSLKRRDIGARRVTKFYRIRIRFWIGITVCFYVLSPSLSVFLHISFLGCNEGVSWPRDKAFEQLSIPKDTWKKPYWCKISQL